MSVPSPCNTHAPPSQLRAKRWQSGDWEPSRGWGPCPCLTQGLQFPVTPTLPSRLRLLGQVGGSWGQAFIRHLLHARHWHSAFLESSNNPVGGSGEKTGPEGSRPPRATLLRGSPPASSPAGTGRRSGLWDSRDRRTRRRSRPKVAATSAAPISGTSIRSGSRNRKSMIVTRKRKGHPTGEAQRAEAGSGAEAKVGCSPKCRSASGAFGHLGLGPLICLPQPVLHARSMGQLPGLAAGRPQGVWSP